MPFPSLPLLFCPIFVFFGLITLIAQRAHILNSLMILEAIMLNLLLMILLMSNTSSLNNMFLALILLTIGACEATLGLASMVAMTRAYGNDSLTSTSLNMC